MVDHAVGARPDGGQCDHLRVGRIYSHHGQPGNTVRYRLWRPVRRCVCWSLRLNAAVGFLDLARTPANATSPQTMRDTTTAKQGVLLGQFGPREPAA